MFSIVNFRCTSTETGTLSTFRSVECVDTSVDTSELRLCAAQSIRANGELIARMFAARAFIYSFLWRGDGAQNSKPKRKRTTGEESVAAPAMPTSIHLRMIIMAINFGTSLRFGAFADRVYVLFGGGSEAFERAQENGVLSIRRRN